MKNEPTREEILDIASRQLAEWRKKLNTECFIALRAKCRKEWKKKHKPLDIFRGNDMTEFILNWKGERDSV